MRVLVGQETLMRFGLTCGAAALLAMLPCATFPASAQPLPQGVDVFVGYSFMRTPEDSDAGLTPVNSNGWQAAVNLRARSWIGFVFEVAGEYGERRMFPTRFQPRATKPGAYHQTMVLLGPQIRIFTTHRVSANFRAMAGATSIGELVLPLREPFQPPGESGLVTEFRLGDSKPLTGVLGGSLDYRISERISWRLFQPDLVVTNIEGRSTYHFRVSTGIVFTL
jgi:hypothetical protein